MWDCENCGTTGILGIPYCPACGTERPVAKNTVEGGYSDHLTEPVEDENPEQPEGEPEPDAAPAEDEPAAEDQPVPDDAPAQPVKTARK